MGLTAENAEDAEVFVVFVSFVVLSRRFLRVHAHHEEHEGYLRDLRAAYWHSAGEVEKGIRRAADAMPYSTALLLYY